ncbi:MAG TPA: polyphenol oxidase family protein [Planctomycetota bacterium]|nr:polyphenol oxidase family protein [Planctomycetota bacterium]
MAYSTVGDGDQRDRDARHAWLASQGVARCVVPRQIHGTCIVQVDADRDALAQADGVVGTDAAVALGAFGADCPGLVLVAEDALGIAHCGWRGVAGGIVAHLVEAMRTVTATEPTRWHAFIGPGISGRNYEVDQPVLGARTWPSSAVNPVRAGHAMLDVAETIAVDLTTLGITSIQRCGICTQEDPRLWSYRQRGAGQVQVLVAWRAVA